MDNVVRQPRMVGLLPKELVEHPDCFLRRSMRRRVCESALAYKIKPEGAVTEEAITISPGPNFRAAMLLAIAADVLQLAVFPVFVAGAMSPADDILDVGVAAILVRLLGWHWEFLPSFLGKLAPGVDLVPLWTLAVANVYRKSKRIAESQEQQREPPPALKGMQDS